MSNAYDTIIVGAGPAGLAAAADLAAAGARVLVLERKSRIGPKVCAGGVTWSGLFKEIPPEILAASFTAQHIVTPWQKAVIEEPHPMVSTVSREALGEWMAARARESGAEIITGARVEEIGEKKLRCGRWTFSFEHLVGADGSSSMVRRHLGLATVDYGIGIDYRVAGEFSRMEWHLHPQLFANGYAWVFPHGDHASVGAYCHCRTMTALALKRSLHRWAADNRIDLDHAVRRAALIHLDYRGWRFNRVFLAGDAAGLASALTGEGILPAVVSGRAVARALINPGKKYPEMKRLVHKWAIHRNMVRLSSTRIMSSILFEPLVLALRSGIMSFKALEMG